MSWSTIDIDTIKKFSGNKIIFIGELNKGCTFDGNELLNIGYELNDSAKIKNWYFACDIMNLYIKKYLFN